MTRSGARAAGLLYYDEGRWPCPKGHAPVLRLVSNGACLACQREWAADYRLKHRDAHLANKARYRARHPDRVLEQAKQSYHRNKESAIARHKTWLINNPTKRRQYEAKRRAQKNGTSGQYTPSHVAELLIKQGGKCAYCSASIALCYRIDHKTPLCRGGSNSVRNIHLTCNCATRGNSPRHTASSFSS